jgi:hypothetical protein
MITGGLFSCERLDPETAKISLGTRKHPVGSVQVKAHLEYDIPDSIYISVHGGAWHLSFSNGMDVPAAAGAGLPVSLQHLTERAAGRSHRRLRPERCNPGSPFSVTPRGRRAAFKRRSMSRSSGGSGSP